MATHPVAAILSIISSTTKELHALYTQNGSQLPRMDDPLIANPLPNTDKVTGLSELIVAAVNQLTATVRDPKEAIWENATSMCLPAALEFVIDVDIPQILKEGALHVNDIAAETGCEISHVWNRRSETEAKQLESSVISEAATFLEKSPGHCSRAQIRARQKYENAGFAALIGQTKAGPTQFNIIAWGTDKSLRDWYELPENAWRFKRLTSAMKRLKLFFNDQVFLDAYDWSSLQPTDTVVDIAGGVGLVTLAVSRTFTTPKFVLL
ncbi:hypothetical protein NP233_g10333 [Leucocoprinus birnbaumii]|uniref:S-adenosyl-L-methionine-dependent methyltransferase n=1 Tax=Leucocoprinus birnbaumii TaxID=56174 RepID=A0AAD5YM94_9AGAR|nr:hypothetical protein NP233_g10333 [Leucocoprinus birnbaumii]